MSGKLLFALLAIAANSPARGRIGSIEFFGYKGLDVAAIRKALPFRIGDRLGDSTEDRIKRQARAAVQRVTGKNATDIAAICCNLSGDYSLFIGLLGESTMPLQVGAPPVEDIRLPAEFHALYQALGRAEEAAVRKGAAQESEFPGYRLSKDPAARTLELKLRDYATQHEEELVRVLRQSSHPYDRSTAADALGFGARSPRQLAALTEACRDPHPDVRNESARALSEILAADVAARTQIDAPQFIPMLKSGIWTDRNKATGILFFVTIGREPRLLERIGVEAREELLESAAWPAGPWSNFPRWILGRIAGLADARIQPLATAPFAQFLEAIHHE